MKKRIYIADWLVLKPYKKHASTDLYYLAVCNKVKDAISNLPLAEEDVNLFSCLLTSYFEDVISQTNVWKSFINKHQEMYGKHLPFFDMEGYEAEEINWQDIAFLVWYFFSMLNDEGYHDPSSPLFESVAHQVMAVLDEEYETAPENELLQSFYRLDSNADYYEVRKFMNDLVSGTYLFHLDMGVGLLETENEILRDPDENVLSYLQDQNAHFVSHTYTQLLSLKPNEWAALILGKSHPLHQDLLDLSPRVAGNFLCKGQDEKNIHLEHIATGKKFELKKESYGPWKELAKKENSILYIGMVKWQGEWWFSGVAVVNEYDAKIVEEERNSISARSAMSFLDREENNVDEVMKNQETAFLAFNKGSRIAFMPENEIDGFVKDFHDFYNQSLNLSPKESAEAHERAVQEGYLGNAHESMVLDRADPAYVFFNPISGLEIGMEGVEDFPMKENPFYIKSDQEDEIGFLDLIISDSCSKELALYCIEQCSHDSSIFPGTENKHIMDNLDFMMRFYKASAYHTVPNITFTGNSH